MKKYLAIILVVSIFLCSGCSQNFMMGLDVNDSVLNPKVSMNSDSPANNTTIVDTNTDSGSDVDATTKTNGLNLSVENQPMIAITFDDGPSSRTDRLLDVLKKYDVKCTFFVVGNMINYQSESLKRASVEGHEIASHSLDHSNLTKLKKKEIKKQLKDTQKMVEDLTGQECNLLRPPYGDTNAKVEAVAKNLDISIVNWSVDTADWKHKNAKYISKHILKNAKNGDIILCHDLYESTVDAMDRVIPKLIKKGYKIVTVSELLTSDGEELIPGQIYYEK